jgi:hypothetical protein
MIDSAIRSALLVRSFAELLATAAPVAGVDVTPFFPVQTPPPVPGYYFARYAGAAAIVRRYWDGQQWRFRGDVPAYAPSFGTEPGDAWQAVFTEWFDADVAPAYPGHYVREYPALECQAEPDYWDGQRWLIDGGLTANVEVGVPAFRWRGITSLAVPAGHAGVLS